MVLSLLLCRKPILSHKANTKPAYQSVGTEPVNTTPNNPCRCLDGRIRGTFDGQIKHFGRKYQFLTGARDQCSAGTDILGFPGQDALRAINRDRVPDIVSFTAASLVTMCRAFCHGRRLIFRRLKRGGGATCHNETHQPSENLRSDASAKPMHGSI